MIKEFWDLVTYFANLTFEPEVFWTVAQLIVATVIVLVYMEIYKDEDLGWNTYLSNSLVLLFMSMTLLRYIYGINGMGFQNYLDYSDKFLATIFLMLVGSLMVRLNFSHLLPEKIAKYMSSVLSVNLIVYAIVLFVQSNKSFSWMIFSSLLFIIVFLGVLFSLVKVPIKKLRVYLQKEKKKERMHNAKEAVFEIEELKNTLKLRERELKQIKLKEAEAKKHEGEILKKILKKVK